MRRRVRAPRQLYAGDALQPERVAQKYWRRACVEQAKTCHRSIGRRYILSRASSQWGIAGRRKLGRRTVLVSMYASLYLRRKHVLCPKSQSINVDNRLESLP